MPENANELPLADRQDMGLLGVSSQSTDPSQVSVVNPAVNAAGRPYDPATGKLLPTTPAPEPIHDEQPTVRTTTKHSTDLYDAAAYFGISEGEADTIETPTLRKMLRTMTQQQEQAREAQDRARFWEAQRGTAPANEPRPGPAEPDFDLGEELDPSANPKTFGLLKRLAEKEKLLDQKLAGLEGREVGRTQQSHYDAWDDAFSAIGDPRFGEGGRDEMTPGSDELQFRQTLIQAAGIDMSKQTPAQAKRLIQKTYKTLYPDGPTKKPAKPADAAAAGYGGEPTPEPRRQPLPKAPSNSPTKEEWDRGGVGLPTRRAPEQLPEGRERAIAAVAAKMGMRTPDFEQDQEIKSTLLRRNGTPSV